MNNKKDKNGNTKHISQRKMQYNIAEFLCKHYLVSNNREKLINLSYSMTNHKSCLASYIRGNADASKGKIVIAQLI